MRVMVTGDQGYIGSVLVPILINKKYNVVGYDSGFFSENRLEKYNENVFIYKVLHSREILIKRAGERRRGACVYFKNISFIIY